eukprot:3152566-Prymnesium_polylepis.1
MTYHDEHGLGSAQPSTLLRAGPLLRSRRLSSVDLRSHRQHINTKPSVAIVRVEAQRSGPRGVALPQTKLNEPARLGGQMSFVSALAFYVHVAQSLWSFLSSRGPIGYPFSKQSAVVCYGSTGGGTRVCVTGRRDEAPRTGHASGTRVCVTGRRDVARGRGT